MSSDCEGTIAQTDKSYVDEARKDFAHARKINKKLPFSYVDEAALDMQDGQVRKAIDLDLQALKYWPNFPMVTPPLDSPIIVMASSRTP